jgi:hypothetical protein
MFLYWFRNGLMLFQILLHCFSMYYILFVISILSLRILWAPQGPRTQAHGRTVGLDGSDGSDRSDGRTDRTDRRTDRRKHSGNSSTIIISIFAVTILSCALSAPFEDLICTIYTVPELLECNIGN